MQLIKWGGSPITRPGAYSGVNMASYHGRLVEGDSASRSQLWKIIDKSAAHCWLNHYANPEREEIEESTPLLFGRGAHHLLLGEADFYDHFAIRPEEYPQGADFPALIGDMKPWSGNAKWCRAWLAAKSAEPAAIG